MLNDAEDSKQKDPDLSELTTVMKEVLVVLKESTIASKTGKGDRPRFWGAYKRVAEEHDSEFLERCTNDMDIVLLFSGLFSAVSTSFIVAMQINLIPNPIDTTNALLVQLVQIGAGNITAVSTPATPALTWSATKTSLRIQAIAHASLSLSLLAAFGAVLGKQWLAYYKSNRSGRGSEEERGICRQEKFDGLKTWQFDAVVQSFPVLLQISLLLFGIALSADMWYMQPSIAWVIIATTAFGFLFYSLTLMACLISPACPFQTPTSTVLRVVLRVLYKNKLLRPIFGPLFRYLKKLTSLAHSVLQRVIGALGSSWTQVSEALTGPLRAAGAFALRLHKLVSAAFHKGLHHLVPRRGSSRGAGDSEAQLVDQGLDFLAEKECALDLDFPVISISKLEAPSIKWLLETSTDPEVFLAAAKFAPQVEWPLDFDVSNILPQLYDNFTSCVDVQEQIVPSLKEKASACTMALSHIQSGCVLRAYPDCGQENLGQKDTNFLGQKETDGELFKKMMYMCRDNRMVFATTMVPSNPMLDVLMSPEVDFAVLNRLSHVLPYHFVTGQVDDLKEEFARKVILGLLPSGSSPSPQIIANCVFLACVMVGAQVDKKDIVRIDKSSALPRLSESLLVQLQKVLWTLDRDDLGENSTKVAKRALKLLKVIDPILKRAQYRGTPPFDIMKNVDVCRKIYLQAESSEPDDRSDLLSTLQDVVRFIFAAVKVPRDHAQVWHGWYDASSHAPKNFDWLVDYLDYIHSGAHDNVHSTDHEAAYDILLLLGSMGVTCSHEKQELFVKMLIAYMDSTIPDHVRHAALRAAHSAREKLASIDTIDDGLRDMIFTKLSPAILSVLCTRPSPTFADNDSVNHPNLPPAILSLLQVYTRPSPTPADDDSVYHPDHSRDLVYLELIYALVRNSHWHRYLDSHMDQCIKMIPEYCRPRTFSEHALYLAGILCITPKQPSATSLVSATEHQSLLDSVPEEQWNVIRNAWGHYHQHVNYTTCCLGLLLTLAEGTEKHIQTVLRSDPKLIRDSVDCVLKILEQQIQLGLGDLELGNSVIIALNELRLKL